MKKAIEKLAILVIAVTVLMTTVMPTDVNAYTCYADMTYDEVCAYWSSQSSFYQIYIAERDKSGYSDQVKFNTLTYFKCSLNDVVWKENIVRTTRPQTYNYLKAVLNLSGPHVYNTIAGKESSDSLRAVLMEEMRIQAPYLTYNERCQNADVILELLKKNGVTTKSQYEFWKRMNGGKTAFEIYINHILDYNDYWNKINQMNQANQAAIDEINRQQEQAAQQMQQQWEQQQAQAQQAMEQQQAQMEQAAQQMQQQWEQMFNQ